METHGGGGDQDLLSRSARIRAFRAMQRAPPEERERMRREMEELSGNAKQTGRPSWKAVHLLSAEEIKSLFTDVVRGLGFLVCELLSFFFSARGGNSAIPHCPDSLAQQVNSSS